MSRDYAAANAEAADYWKRQVADLEARLTEAEQGRLEDNEALQEVVGQLEAERELRREALHVLSLFRNPQLWAKAYAAAKAVLAKPETRALLEEARDG